MGPSSLALALALGAAEPTVLGSSLEWTAPPSCPDAEAVATRIAQLVGRAPGPDAPRVAATVQGSGSTWQMTISIGVDATAERRTLTAPTCDALADVAALLVAVVAEPVQTAAHTEVGGLVVPDVSSTPQPTSGRSVRSPRRPVNTTPADRATPQPRPRPTTALVPSLRLRAGGLVGAVPGATGGGDLGVAIAGRFVRGELVGGYWLPRRVVGSGREIRVSLGTISPRLCGVLPRGRVGVVACLGPEIGVMRGVTAQAVHQPPWVAAAIEFGARIALRGRLALWASAAATAPMRFPVFRLRDGVGGVIEVFRPAAAAGRLVVGLEVGLGRRAKQ